jgi:hypothetical protein
MARRDEQWTYIGRGDNSRVITLDTDVTLATALSSDDAKYIVELHNRERRFLRSLANPSPNIHPFVVETLRRDGEPERYRVSRKGIGGVYSDEFDNMVKAAYAAKAVENDEENKEQLRYRIWALEQQLKWALGELKPRYEEPYEEWAPERVEYNKALATLNGESK